MRSEDEIHPKNGEVRPLPVARELWNDAGCVAGESKHSDEPVGTCGSSGEAVEKSLRKYTVPKGGGLLRLLPGFRGGQDIEAFGGRYTRGEVFAEARGRGCRRRRAGVASVKNAACAGDAQIEPGDFYVYLFEHDRLYRRLRSYEGRAHLGPFLRGYALPDMFNQFRAMVKKETLETVSLDADGPRQPSAATASDVRESDPDGAERCTDLFAQLGPEKRLLIKLLYIEDCALEPDEIQVLAKQSHRSVREVVELIEQARESVRQRELGRQRKIQEAESAAQWILQYERRLAVIAGGLVNVPPGSASAEQLCEEQAGLERKRTWRQQQRAHALEASRRASVTLRYREIAHLLNVPVGSVSAQVTRLRQELTKLAAQRASERRSFSSPPGEGSG